MSFLSEIDFKRQVRETNLLKLQNIDSHNSDYYADCPKCGKKQNKKEKKGFSYNPDKNKDENIHGIFNCYSCRYKGTGYKLYCDLTGKEYKQSDSYYNSKKNNSEKKNLDNEKITPDNGNNSEKVNSDNGNKKEVKVEKFNPTNWNLKWFIKDKNGVELYRKYRFHNFFGTKAQAFAHYVDEILYKGLTTISGERIPTTFYGLDKIKNFSILHLLEGERKTDTFQKFWDSNNTKKNSYLSSTTGSTQILEDSTLELIKERNIEKVILWNDIDFSGRKYVINNLRRLQEAGVKAYIINLHGFMENYFPEIQIPDESSEASIDIEDIILSTKGIDSKKFLHEIYNKLNEVIESEEELMKLQTAFFFRSSINPKDNKESSEDIGKIVFDSKYISQSISSKGIIDLASRLKIKTICTESYQGSGKTELYKDLGDNNKILVVTFLRELAKQLSEDYSVLSYENLGVGKIKAEDYNNSLVIVLNSLRKISSVIDNIHEYIVIIDEIDAVIMQTLISPLIEKIRPDIYKIINDIITKSKLTILSSSDFPPELMTYLEDIHKEAGKDSSVLHIKNKYLEDKTYYDISDKDTALDLMVEKLKDNKKFSVSINSTNQFLLRYLKEKCPDKEFLFVSSDERTKEINYRIERKDFSGIDCLIYTPTLFTGNSFHIPEMEDHFIYSTNKDSTDHFSLMQSGKRNRKAKNIYVYIKESKGRLETDIDKLIKAELDKDHSFRKYDSPTVKTDYTFLQRGQTFQALRNRSLNTLKESFWNLVKSKCRNPIQIVRNKDKSLEDKEEIKQYTKKIKQELKEEKINSILESDYLSTKRFSEIEILGSLPSNNELNPFRKTKITVESGILDSSKDFKETVSLGIEKIQSIKKNIELIVKDEKGILEKDILHYSSFISDNSYNILKTRQLKEDIQILFPELDFSSLKKFLKSSRRSILPENISKLNVILENPEEAYKRKIHYGFKTDIPELNEEELKEDREELEKRNQSRIKKLNARIDSLKEKLSATPEKEAEKFQIRKENRLFSYQNKLEGLETKFHKRMDSLLSKLNEKLESTEDPKKRSRIQIKIDKIPDMIQKLITEEKERLESKISSLKLLESDTGLSKLDSKVKGLEDQIRRLQEESELEIPPKEMKGSYLFRSIIQRFGLKTESHLVKRNGKVVREYFLERKRLLLVLKIFTKNILVADKSIINNINKSSATQNFFSKNENLKPKSLFESVN